LEPLYVQISPGEDIYKEHKELYASNTICVEELYEDELDTEEEDFETQYTNTIVL
jgi:hypothetical protein